MNRLKLHSEKPIQIESENIYGNDSLGFKESVKRFSQIVSNAETPFCAGVIGDWGCGKTSFMKLMQKEIESEYKLDTFWFDAWQYENEASLLIPLFTKMTQKYKKHKAILSKIKRSASVLLLTGADVMLKSFTVDRVSVEDIHKNFQLYETNVEKTYDKWIDEMDSLKKQFALLSDKIKGCNNAFIIFIDDLDRCLPENAIKMLENIKHFLAVEGSACIFIIGIDSRKISKGIQAKYGEKLLTSDEYLEKFLNLKIAIPSKADNYDKLIFSSFNAFLGENIDKTIEKEIATFSEIVAPVGINNPRRLKQVILRYAFFLLQQDFNEFNREIIIKLIILREFCKDIYEVKKRKNEVHYVPKKDASEETKLLELIENHDLLTKQSIERLLDFSFDVLTQIKHGFNVKEDKIKKMIDSTQEEGTKKLLKQMVDLKEKREHKIYFKLTDFLFNLSM